MKDLNVSFGCLAVYPIHDKPTGVALKMSVKVPDDLSGHSNIFNRSDFTVMTHMCERWVE